MTIWQIILIICGAITAIAFIIAFIGLLLDDKKFKDKEWWMLLAMLVIIPLMIFWVIYILGDYIIEIWKDGGFRKHYQLIKESKAAYEAEQKRLKEEEVEYDIKRTAYLDGLLTRDELPRLDGIHEFEFEDEMNLSVDYDAEVREIVYVENEYCESLNSFFIRHKDLRLYHMYKFVYLPNFSTELNSGELARYISPNLPAEEKIKIDMDSSYPIKYLWYPENARNIQHGMMFFRRYSDYYGIKYIKGDYFHLKEGTDEEVIEQLRQIVKDVHSLHAQAALYCTTKANYKEDSSEEHTDEYADKLFETVNNDPEIAIIVKEVRERVNALRERGMAEKLIQRIIHLDPKLSRLVITKDMRIMLPDYNNMEIMLEPLNKAVFLLFLRHLEGIVFKHLPDYRKELADIYQMIKPLGLNERALQSIEDVTNPLLNSINEKCARIRGAFVSKFDEDLAQYYYIYGRRGEPKKISLPRELVIWEK